MMSRIQLGAVIAIFLCLGSCRCRKEAPNLQDPENAASGHLLQDEGSHEIQLRMVHRSSPESPQWRHKYADRFHLLDELMEMDRRRLEHFRRALQDAHGGDFEEKEAAAAPAPGGGGGAELRVSTARIRRPLKQDEQLASKIVSGSSVGAGQFFAEVQIGTPPQKFPLIVDTGSDLTWVQCSPPNTTTNSSSSSSSSSNSSAPWFRKSLSSSFRQIPCTADECMFLPAPVGSTCSSKRPTACDYSYAYSDSSTTTGIFAYETISMRSRSRSKRKSGPRQIRIDNVAIGCGADTTGTGFLGASGVLGLGQGPVSFSTQLGPHLGGIFSYCLVDYLALGGPNSGSVLAFGKSKAGKAGLQYTPLVKHAAAGSFYYVNVSHVEVDEEVVEGTNTSTAATELWGIDHDGNGGTIFDSGTTLSYFREPAFSKIMGALNKSITLPRATPIRGLDLCFNVSGLPQKVTKPKLEIHFERGAVLGLRPSNYMVLAAQDVKCVALVAVTDRFGSNVIGNVMQQNFHVEYDRAKSRVGFRWSPCSGKQQHEDKEK